MLLTLFHEHLIMNIFSVIQTRWYCENFHFKNLRISWLNLLFPTKHKTSFKSWYWTIGVNFWYSYIPQLLACFIEISNPDSTFCWNARKWIFIEYPRVIPASEMIWLTSMKFIGFPGFWSLALQHAMADRNWMSDRLANTARLK